MNCPQCRELLDNLLVTRPDEATRAELRTHLEQCPDCACEHAAAEQALALLTLSKDFRASPDLKERIMTAIPEVAFEDIRPIQRRSVVDQILRRGLAVATAAAVVVAAVYLLRPAPGPGPDGNGPVRFSAMGLFVKACAAEEAVFTGDGVVHIENEIVVKPTADPNWARMRWLPIISLEPTGKTRFHQLSLPAEVDQGYSVKDESWYDPASGRFARLLTVDKKPLLANAYDGKTVYWLERVDGTAPTIVRHDVSEDFLAPKSPADYLGIAAGIRTSLDGKNEDLVSDAGEATLDDGMMARVLKVALPEPESDAPVFDAYHLFTIREDDNTIAKMEFFADDKLLLVVRRVQRELVESPGVPWNLAGIEGPLEEPRSKSPVKIVPDMVVPNVTVEQMIEKADFDTYVFSADPPWAGQRQIADILDIVSPLHRMFAITRKADDGRHVVLVQSHSYNKMLGPLAKRMGKVVYTSPVGVKVLSSPRDHWLAGILLQSAQGAIKFKLSDDRTGYLLQTPSGTYPALAVNGHLTDEELHALIDSLALAKDCVKEDDSGSGDR
jgi:hypothetical protein